MTPELWPVWWAATRSSFSSTVTVACGYRAVISWAVASPTIPAPMTTNPATRSAYGSRHPQHRADAHRHHRGEQAEHAGGDPGRVVVAVEVAHGAGSGGRQG